MSTGFRIDVMPLAMGDREPLRILVDTEDGRTTTVFEIVSAFHCERQTVR